MNLRTLRIFVEVVRQGGFSQAAATVSLTQSAVSKAVRTLEEELGLPLLNRLGHRIELTPAGEIAYRRAQTMLAERQDLLVELDELKGLQRGVLRIGIPPVGSGVVFAAMFAAYRSRYPAIEIALLEHGGQKLNQCLHDGEIDVAAILAPVHADFDFQEVRVEPLVALMSASHPLAGSGRVDFTQLATTPFILFEGGFALNRIILDACARKGVQPKITARSAQIDFIVDLVAAGLGVAFFPRMLAEKHRREDIWQAPLDEPHTDWHMTLAWRRQAYLPPAARAWLELAAQMQR